MAGATVQAQWLSCDERGLESHRKITTKQKQAAFSSKLPSVLLSLHFFFFNYDRDFFITIRYCSPNINIIFLDQICLNDYFTGMGVFAVQ